MPAAVIADPERLGGAVPLFLLARGDGIPEGAEEAARLSNFQGELDQIAIVPGGVLVGAGDGADPLALGAAAAKLPTGDYRIEQLPNGTDEADAVRAFAMGAYRFTKYREAISQPALIIKDKELAERTAREAATIGFGRDLINTPAEDMGPDALEEVARALAAEHGADIKVHKGEGFAEDFPLIHAVGRAAAPGKEPRLIELNWSGGEGPLVALVGKGVCFDTGGLNLKPGKSMELMKKDMGGAATSLALARRIMEEGLSLNLRLLIPAVENAVAGNAFRPGDIFPSRHGQTVEISNTDAEGRLILADAMTFATEGKPDRLITLATLTGAARVALGPDLPPIYSTEPRFQDLVLEAGTALNDPLWPMPFWDRYQNYLSSDLADVNHAASTPFAGSITAALFLKRFSENLPYTHIDTFAWVPQALPARPKGGEVLTMRALFRALSEDSAAK